MHSPADLPVAHASVACAAPLQITPPEVPKASPEGGGPCAKDATERVGQSRHSRVRRGVAETSAEAFHSLPVADYLAPKERAVLALFTGPEVKLSRQQIAAALPMPINGVCGRVDSLLAGRHLEEAGDRIDPLTRKRQKLLQLPRAAQRELGEGDRA